MTTAPTSPAGMPAGDMPSGDRSGPAGWLVAVLGSVARLLDTRGGLMIFGFGIVYCSYAFILKPMQADNKSDVAAVQKITDGNTQLASELAQAMRELKETAKTMKETALIQQGRQPHDPSRFNP